MDRLRGEERGGVEGGERGGGLVEVGGGLETGLGRGHVVGVTADQHMFLSVPPRSCE